MPVRARALINLFSPLPNGDYERLTGPTEVKEHVGHSVCGYAGSSCLRECLTVTPYDNGTAEVVLQCSKFGCGANDETLKKELDAFTGHPVPAPPQKD